MADEVVLDPDKDDLAARDSAREGVVRSVWNIKRAGDLCGASGLDRKVERVPRFDAMNKFEKLSSINNSIYHLLAARAARAT